MVRGGIPDPNSNPDANPHLNGEQQSVATSGREKMGWVVLISWTVVEVGELTAAYVRTHRRNLPLFIQSQRTPNPGDHHQLKVVS
jgi:hypothetical protein